jgi:hypothetical protein
MIKIKLDLQSLTDLEMVDETKIIATKLTGNANFPVQPLLPATLTNDATTLDGLIQQRAALDSQSQQLTLQIRTARLKCESDIGLEASYVEQVINTIVAPATAVDPVVAAAKAKSAGMDVVGSSHTPVGAMPKVEGLKATQGDANGSVDLQWNPVKRGLNNYIMEQTDDPAGLTGWKTIGTPSKSSMIATGLTSGTRYWFRVSANGAAGSGPASDAATKVAP